MENLDANKIVPVVLCGGTGSRLWPISRASFPKQYTTVDQNKSITFFQATINRIKNFQEVKPPIVICNEEHRFIVAEQLREINIKNSSILLEPFGRNTAPAVTIACFKAIENNEDPLMLILPADHVIQNVEVFENVLYEATKYADLGKIVLFGISPDKPETGFGYIESKNDLDETSLKGEEILRFIEKPDLNTAKEFIKQKRFTWNSGIFLFKAKTMLNEIKLYSELMYKSCEESLLKSSFDLDFQRIDRESFSRCKNISIDLEILEKTSLGVVLPLNVRWNDLGSWQSMWDIGNKDNMGNVLTGNVQIKDVKDSYLRSEERLIAVVGLKDIVVVETKDAVLVSSKDKTQDVKNIVKDLIEKNMNEADSHQTIYRPWGNYTSLANDCNWQVKKIIVKQNQSLSLQLHNHRTEHWIVVNGKALVEIDGKKNILSKNESTYIPLGIKHRLSNIGNDLLILIEVQSGTYLEEDDIVRFEDNYGRL